MTTTLPHTLDPENRVKLARTVRDIATRNNWPIPAWVDEILSDQPETEETPRKASRLQRTEDVADRVARVGRTPRTAKVRRGLA